MQNISLKVIPRTTDAFMKAWRKECYSCRRSVTSILHILGEAHAETKKRLSDADETSLKRLKIFVPRGPKWYTRCCLRKCWQNNISQSSVKPPSRMQERPQKVRKSAWQVSSSMRPTFYAACRTALCGRCTGCSRVQWNLHMCSVAPSQGCGGS